MPASGKYIHQLFRDAKKSGEKAAKHFEEEDIHKWRVAVKKIKAAFLFFKFFDQNLSDEELKLLKKIFGAAGKTRELQLVQVAVRKFRIAGYAETKNNLLRDLLGKEKKAREKFQKRFKEHGEDVLIKVEEVIREPEKKLLPDKFPEYFRSKVEEILLQIQMGNLTEKEYHDLRKQLKELKYNLSFANENLKKSVFASFSEKELTQLEKSLGDWHDQIFIREWLSKFAESPVMDENVRSFITALTHHSQQVAGRMLKRIQKQLGKKIK